MSATPELRRLIAGESLDREEMRALVGRVVDGLFGEAEIAALLVALAIKGETVEELTGAAQALRQRVRPVPHTRRDLLDTCGTGGDGCGTFNISTAAAFVAAAGGVVVAKHGNRAISSRSGSADVLAALGLEMDADPPTAARQLDEIGIAFLFAPHYHPAMKVVAPVRKALGVRTLFNLLGPLVNPAGARRQLLGVFSRDWVRPLAKVLAELGVERALVVHGVDGLDEITTTGPTFAALLSDGELCEMVLEPEALGLRTAQGDELLGGSPEENAARLEQILSGQGPQALTEIVAANAGAAIWIADKAATLREGVNQARDLLSSGKPREKLEALRAFSASRSEESA